MWEPFAGYARNSYCYGCNFGICTRTKETELSLAFFFASIAGVFGFLLLFWLSLLESLCRYIVCVIFLFFKPRFSDLTRDLCSTYLQIITVRSCQSNRQLFPSLYLHIILCGYDFKGDQKSFGFEDDYSEGSIDRSGGFCCFSKLVHSQRRLNSQ